MAIHASASVDTMVQETEPGSKEALYEEIRRRIARKRDRDSLDVYEGAVRGVREFLIRSSDIAGSVLGSRTAQLLAVVLTFLFASAVVFMALDPEWNQQVPADDATQYSASPPVFN